MNPILQWFSVNYAHFGWVGSSIISLGCLAAAIPYIGKDGRKYSWLNHYISELGEIGVSKLAAVFNTGMILGGIAFFPFIIGLGLTLATGWSYLAMAAGLVAAAASVCVGIFSMDKMDPHVKAAMTFFRMGLLTILLFTIAIFLQPAAQRTIPLSVNIFGVLAVIAYSAFLLQPKENHEENNLLDPQEKQERPRFWKVPFLEWLLFFTTIVWFMCVSLILIA
jgi:hypothetical protein